MAARDFLVAHRNDYETAYNGFRWPDLDHFNWALDHFDPMATNNSRTALWVVNEDGGEVKVSFQEMAAKSLFYKRHARVSFRAGKHQGIFTTSATVWLLQGSIQPEYFTALSKIGPQSLLLIFFRIQTSGLFFLQCAPVASRLPAADIDRTSFFNAGPVCMGHWILQGLQETDK